eukprot:TRINITY_DN2025_c0_g1_i1.p1 TRINITY_DN2025_c0_g1~~TRINITY_DN2025_c0_g1_i1.p1  ORF type:complete len:549 (+),score=105.36 TRINITY_DN2025_c0_g1_i1:94-1740(+)
MSDRSGRKDKGRSWLPKKKRRHDSRERRTASSSSAPTAPHILAALEEQRARARETAAATAALEPAAPSATGPSLARAAGPGQQLQRHSSAEAKQSARQLPGFVYDASTNRYFKRKGLAQVPGLAIAAAAAANPGRRKLRADQWHDNRNDSAAARNLFSSAIRWRRGGWGEVGGMESVLCASRLPASAGAWVNTIEQGGPVAVMAAACSAGVVVTGHKYLSFYKVVTQRSSRSSSSSSSAQVRLRSVQDLWLPDGGGLNMYFTQVTLQQLDQSLWCAGTFASPGGSSLAVVPVPCQEDVLMVPDVLQFSGRTLEGLHWPDGSDQLVCAGSKKFPLSQLHLRPMKAIRSAYIPQSDVMSVACLDSSADVVLAGARSGEVSLIDFRSHRATDALLLARVSHASIDHMHPLRDQRTVLASSRNGALVRLDARAAPHHATLQHYLPPDQSAQHVHRAQFAVSASEATVIVPGQRVCSVAESAASPSVSAFLQVVEVAHSGALRRVELPAGVRNPVVATNQYGGGGFGGMGHDDSVLQLYCADRLCSQVYAATV